ncbi:hypothetical protein Tco_0601983 [Tanacetum coccineum]
MASTSNRSGKAKTSQPWTITEEITLCTTWCKAMENYDTGDMKKGFWLEVFANFEKEMRGGGLFEDTIPSVQRMDENGSSGLVLFQNVLAEFETGYIHPFTMEACWRILKNHEAWTEVEMPSFNQRQQQQLLLDEEALRETLEEEVSAEKELEERIKVLEEEARKNKLMMSYSGWNLG